MSFVPKFFYMPRKKWTEGSDVLEPGENYWKFQDDSDEEHKSSIGIEKSIKDLSIEEQAKQHCFKKIVGILNKMTPDKLQTLMEDMKIESIDVGMLADVIFSKALVDEVYSEMYAKLCEGLRSELSDDYSKSFEQVLIYLCETGYDNLLDFTDNDLNSVHEDKRYTFRRRLMTMMRFIGELACIKKPIFSRQCVWKMAECLIHKGGDLHLEAVYFLLFTISVRSNVNTWPKSIEKEVKKIFKLYSSGSFVSSGTNTELEEKKSNLCLPGRSCETVSDIQCCDNISPVAEGKSLKVEEGKISFPDFLHSVVNVILDDSGNIKPAESTLLKLHVELMSKNVDCFKSQMHISDSMSIISFNDRFSYDWFISHVNKQLTAEEKFICIDADKYSKTTFVVIKVNCDFARGVELFAKTELEVLKIISESNVDFPTSNWRIVQTSIKCVLKSYCFTVTALVDLDSSSLFSSSKNYINIGSDCAHVYTSKLPSMCAKEKEHDLKALENEVECCQKTNRVEKCENDLITTSDGSRNEIDKIDSTSNQNQLIESKGNINVNLLMSVPVNDSSLADQKNNKSTRNKPKFKRKFNGAHSFKSRRGIYNCNKQNNSNSVSLVNDKQCCCNREIRNYLKTVNTTVCNEAKNVDFEPSSSMVEGKSGTPLKELMFFNANEYCNAQNKVKFNRSDKWRRIRNDKNSKCSYPEHDYYGEDPYVKKESPQNQSKPKWKSNNPDILKCKDQHKSETVFTSGKLRNYSTNQQNTACVEMTGIQRCRRFKDLQIQQDRQLSMQSRSKPITHNIDLAELQIKNTSQQQPQSPKPNAACVLQIKNTCQQHPQSPNPNAACVEMADIERGRRFKDIKTQQERQLNMQSSSRSITHVLAEPQIKNTPQQQSQTPNPNTYLKYTGKPLVIGIFPNSSQYKDENIFDTLNKCNSNLNIFEQMVLCRFDKEKSVQLTFTVEDLTFKELQKTNFRVRYKAYTILVKPLTSWAEAMTFSDFNC